MDLDRSKAAPTTASAMEMSGGSASAAAHRYRVTNLLRFPVGAGSELVYFPDTRAAHVIRSEIVRLLDTCRSFETLDRHQELLSVAFGTGAAPASTVRRLLEDFVAAGFLLRQDALLSPAQAPPRPEPYRGIASLGFVTRNRPDALRRSVASYVEHCRNFGRSVDFIVMDDTDSAAARAEQRDSLGKLARSHDVTIFYAGMEEKRRYLDALVRRTALPKDLVEFALFDVYRAGAAIGANRNALLLHTAGDLFLSADDDTVCRVVTIPEATRNLAFFTESDPTEFWFFPTREQALEATVSAERDLLALHEEMLGRDLASIIGTFAPAGPARIETMCPQLLQALQSGAGRVVITLNGVVGDCGMPSPVGLLAGVQETTRARMIRSEAEYRTALTSREVVHLAPRATVYHGSQCMSTVLAFDNRILLPPFFPVQRNEDGIFGLTVSQCVDSSFFGHLPWALLHAADPQRRYPTDYLKSLYGRGIADVICLSILSHQFRPGRRTSAQRMDALGLHLIELGSLALEDFEEVLRSQLWQYSGPFLNSVEKILRTHGNEPAFWAADLRRYAETVREALPHPDHVVPLDLREGRSREEAAILSQRLVRRFGELLRAWPAIVEGARSLRAAGQRVAIRV